MKKPLLCRIKLHRFRFQRPTHFGNGALEICTRCGRGRILNFAAGAYEYFDAQAIEARRAGTEGSGAKHESAVACDAPEGGSHD